MMSEHKRPATRSERAYKALLKAYPKEFREEYGSWMVQAFGNLCGEERRRRGVWGLVRLWVFTLLDLAVTAASAERSIVTKSSPGLALLLSLFLPGLGQLYNRQVVKGLPWVLVSALYLASVTGLGYPGSLGDGAVVVLVVSTLVLLPAQVWSLIDAYEVAKQPDTVVGG